MYYVGWRSSILGEKKKNPDIGKVSESFLRLKNLTQQILAVSLECAGHDSRDSEHQSVMR